jgi:glycosyltransferase involved in cell wall biosynthesis
VCATPQVSVLLPYRDAEATVHVALGSVLEESRVRLEVLAVDDGSTDAGAAIVEDWARRDPRVRHIRGTGDGIASALNLAARHAQADVLARMDADDISLPGRLERQLRLLGTDPLLGAVGAQVEPFADGAVGNGLLRYVRWQNALVTPEDHERDLFVESPLCHPSVAMRREAFEAVGGYREGPFPEDYDLWLRLHCGGWRLAKVPEVLLRWRHHPQRATFRDTRYLPERFRTLKAEHLASRLRDDARPLTIWGAGPTGKRMARAIEPHGVRAHRFVDIDPRKVGGTARGAPVVSPMDLRAGAELVVVAVGAAGARAEIRAHLGSLGFTDTMDFICVA